MINPLNFGKLIGICKNNLILNRVYARGKKPLHVL